MHFGDMCNWRTKIERLDWRRHANKFIEFIIILSILLSLLFHHISSHRFRYKNRKNSFFYNPILVSFNSCIGIGNHRILCRIDIGDIEMRRSRWNYCLYFSPWRCDAHDHKVSGRTQFAMIEWTTQHQHPVSTSSPSSWGYVCLCERVKWNDEKQILEIDQYWDNDWYAAQFKLWPKGKPNA